MGLYVQCEILWLFLIYLYFMILTYILINILI